MRESLYRSYSLKGTALALLLSTKDVVCPMLFDFVSERDKTEDFLYAVDQMTRDGVVVPAGDKLLAQEPYSSMVECIASSPITVRIRSPYYEGGDCFVYQDKDDKEKLVLLSRSVRKKDTVLLTCLDKKALFGKYFSDDELPEEIGATLDPELLELSEVMSMMAALCSKSKITNVHFLFGAELFGKEGMSEKRIAAFQSATGVYCAVERGADLRVSVYNKEELKERLWEMFEGVEEIKW